VDWILIGRMKVLKALVEAVVKEKHPGSPFLALSTYNSQHEWLILPFGIGSNLFKLLCIEYNILLLIEHWYCHFICNACFYDLDP